MARQLREMTAGEVARPRSQQQRPARSACVGAFGSWVSTGDVINEIARVCTGGFLFTSE